MFKQARGVSSLTGASYGMRSMRIVGCVSVFLLSPSIPLVGQFAPDMTVDAATRAAVIEGVVKELSDFYVFPDVAA
jgi:hypothetical protein